MVSGVVEGRRVFRVTRRASPRAKTRSPLEAFDVSLSSPKVGEQRGHLPHIFSVSVRGEIRPLVLTLWIDCKH